MLVDKQTLLPPMPPILAPLPERQDDRQQGLPLRGQRIDNLTTVIGVGSPAKNPAADELAQSVGQDISRDAETRLEFFEVDEPVE